MNALLLLFFDICRLRRGPQDVPYSGALMALAVGAYLFAGFLVGYIDLSAFGAALQAAIDTTVLGAVAWGLLKLHRSGHRFVQTFSALAGSGTIIQLVSLLPTWLFWLSGHKGHSVALMLIVLLVWNIAVVAHIMRHAMSTRLAVGVLSALAYVYLSAHVIHWLTAAGS